MFVGNTVVPSSVVVRVFAIPTLVPNINGNSINGNADVNPVIISDSLFVGHLWFCDIYTFVTF
jgi:hypothetical protein